MSVTPFRIEIPEADLADLRQRLERARWPEPETVTDWSQGVPLAYQQELCRYWADGYDWRATEARLNALPQFRTEIDGLSIHFLHVRSPHAEALPRILTHGWPGSIVEFLKVIAPLSDPTAHGGDAADAFHVVCPSLPGYGFSGRPAQPGWNVQRIAAAWMTLMARLGYQRYAAEQATKPQTVGYGLVDSPVGLAAWIAEKFWSWTDCDGHLETVLTRDELLDNVMLYWLPGTGASSARLYWESFSQVSEWFTTSTADTVAVPAGCSIFPKEIPRPSRRWAARRYTDIRYWHELDKGGHFAAFERPEAFVTEMRSFFR